MRACSAAFLVRGGTVLMGLRSPDRDFHPGVWDAIGGHAESGETAEETLVREVTEEVGVRPIAWDSVAVLDELEWQVYGPGRCHVFSVWKWSGEPRLVGDEHSALRWCSLQDIAVLDLADPRYPAVLAGFMGKASGLCGDSNERE